MKQLQTRLFGPVTYAAADVLHFPAGLPSFEDEREFLLLPIEGSDALLCLQSIATPALAFIVMNPFTLSPDYAPVLRPGERQTLAVTRDQDLCFYVLCAMKRPVEDSTVNLKCPIALNPDTRTAMQVILETDHYHMHHPLSSFSREKEDAVC